MTITETLIKNILDDIENYIRVQSDDKYTLEEPERAHLSYDLFQAFERVSEAERERIFKVVEPVFEEWAVESQYVTGAWNSGNENPDKQGEWWDNRNRTAWKQFAHLWDKRLAGRKVEALHPQKKKK